MPSGYGLGSNIQLEALVMVAFFIYYRFRIRGIYSNNILFFLIFILCDSLFTMVIYPEQSVYRTISTAFSYFLFLGYFPLVHYLESDARYRKFMSIMTVSSLFVTIVALAFTVSVNFRGEEIFHFSQAYKTFERTGNVRIYYVLENYIRVSQLVSLGWLLSNRCKTNIEKLLHLLNYIAVFVGIIYIDQSRFYLFATIIVSIIMILMSDGRFKKWIIFGLLIAFIGVILSDVVVAPFASAQVNDSSFQIRLEAISYYFRKALQNPFFGLGLLSPGSSDTYLRYIFYGPKLAYFQDDVGIFGFLGGFGFVGAIWYFVLIKKIFRYGKDCRSDPIYWGLFISIVMSSFTMLWIDKQRLVGMLLALAILDKEAKIEIRR